MKKFNLKKLVLSISSMMALGVASILPTSQASDIEIYKAPERGDTTIMFMLDVSGSMTAQHTDENTRLAACELTIAAGAYSVELANETRVAGGPTYRRQWCQVGNNKHYDRITRLKDAMIDVLHGNPTEGITRIDDDKVIGLSTLGANNGVNVRTAGLEVYNSGSILVPARKLSEVVNGKTQRQILIEAIVAIEASSATPTSRSFAETVAYLFGTTTAHNARREVGWISDSTYNNASYGTIFVSKDCVVWDNQGRCTQLEGGNFNARSVRTGNINKQTATRRARVSLNGRDFYDGTYYDEVFPAFGFNVSKPETKNGNLYKQPTSLAELKAKPENLRGCSTQGIYVLTDGYPTVDTNGQTLIRKAINSENFTCNGSFGCSEELSKILLDPKDSRNLAKVQIKTAVVGFGKDFNIDPNSGVKPYEFLKAREGEDENAAYIRRRDHNLRNIQKIATPEVQAAARWGVIGDGGWYSGNSSAEVVQSIADFLATLDTSVQTLPTGAPTIPVDALNTQDFMDKAYYAAFTPRPEMDYQLWTGDMNQFDTKEGKLVDNGGNSVFDAKGKFNAAANALWKAQGNLPIQVTNNTIDSKRKILTNRSIEGSAGVNGQRLQTVNLDSLFGGVFNNDPYKNYWLNLLGYKVTRDAQVTRNTLPTVELRQMGATMHSTPLLLTQEGKVVEKENDVFIDKDTRKDFLLYGSTQGVLHVLDTKNGVEKFAFVPHEMLEKQRDAFLSQESTFGGKSKLFYGIDGAWTAHTLYTVDEDEVSKVLSEDNNKEIAHQWVYGGLRMGGKSYYALDLSDMDNPEMKFHINPEQRSVHHAHNNQTTTYQELQFMGQSWSRPTLGYVNWRNASNEVEKRLVMFVGGGYDEGYETTNYVQNNGVGAGVYMFDANTGELLWWASNNSVTGGNVSRLNIGELKYSVVSRINAIDRDGDGLVDNLYFGDLAGQAFRIDLNNKADNNANFARRSTLLFTEHKTDGTSPRFYEMPSIAVFKDEGGGSAGKNFATVAFVSGDRSSPYSAGTNPDPLNPNDRTKDKTLPTAEDGVFVVYDNDLNKHELYDADYEVLTTSTTLLSNQKLSEGVPRRAEDGTYNRGWKYIYPSNSATTGGRPGSLKGIGEPRTFVNFLYATAYNKDKTQIEGQCGSGVIGVSHMVRFCLPTGKCDPKVHGKDNSHSTMNGGDKDSPFIGNERAGTVDDSLGNAGSSNDVKFVGSGGDSIKARIQPGISKIRWYESK